MDGSKLRLFGRDDICGMRKRGRTSQISDENLGLWPKPSIYRGRTPLWTYDAVERGLAEEVRRLGAANDEKRSELRSDMLVRQQGRAALTACQ